MLHPDVYDKGMRPCENGLYVADTVTKNRYKLVASYKFYWLVATSQHAQRESSVCYFFLFRKVPIKKKHCYKEDFLIRLILLQ